MYGNFFHVAMQWQAASVSAAQIGIAAASVMQARMMQMALGTMKPEEATRMMLEKPSTFMRSTEGAARAAAANRGPAAVAEAALAPYRTATRANARRLGAKTPLKRRR
jgi:hypothetical protein